MKLLVSLLIVAAVLLPNSAQSQTGSTETFQMMKPVTCTDLTVLLTYLKSEFKEVITWAGKDDQNGFVLLENIKNKTWTLVEFSANTACILGVGSDRESLRKIKE